MTIFLRNKLKIEENQHLFFSAITYDDYCFSENEKMAVALLKQTDKVLVAGIAKPEPFFDYLKSDSDFVLKSPGLVVRICLAVSKAS